MHSSVHYRTKALPRSMIRRVLRNEQAKIYRRFTQAFPPRSDWRVLEVGTNGSLEEARDYFLHSLYPYPQQITAAGLEDPDVFESVFPRYAFVTTPNRRHPIEFHTVTPLLHYLPPRMYRQIYAAAGFEFFSKEENLNLLDAEQLLGLLPPAARSLAELAFHRFLGMKSNLLLSVRAEAE